MGRKKNKKAKIKRLTVPMGTWGILDTKDNTWMGNENGPLLYDEEILAKLAARVLETRLRWFAGRIRAKVYPGGPKQLKDKLTPKIDAVTALKRLESGLEI